MKIKRKKSERGFADYGWLKTFHTFSFSEYYDPNWMGFGPLRVINEDSIAGGGGFPTHGHKDMEIITFVTKGALQHRDSIGNESVIRPGEIQKMSAGTGIQHSEFNASKTELTHLYQIWIVPRKKSLIPSYHQTVYSDRLQSNSLLLLASDHKLDNHIYVEQDLRLSLGRFARGYREVIPLSPQRLYWIQIVSGGCNQDLESGDGLAIQDETELVLNFELDTEFLFFDMGHP